MTLKQINEAIQAACIAEGIEPYAPATEAYLITHSGHIALVAGWCGMDNAVRERVRIALDVPFVSAYYSAQVATMGLSATKLEEE